MSSVPESEAMRAVVMSEFGGPDVLRLADVPVPQPGPGETRLRVEATAVLRTRDVATRSGRHPFSREVTLPQILGPEHVGVVDLLGPGAPAELLGRRVVASSAIVCGRCRPCRAGHDELCDAFQMVGIHRQGAYAELSVVPAVNLHDLPSELPSATAAAMAAVGPTARAQLEAAAVGRGDWVLVPGAAGALGSMAVALARHRGANVIAVEQAGAATDVLSQLGVAAILDGAADDLADQVADASEGGVDAVIDNLSLPELWSRYVPALAPFGRVVISGSIANEPLRLDARQFYLRGQQLLGIRTGNQRHIAAFWSDVRNGFRLPSESIHEYPLAEAAAAHATLEAGGTGGHHVLTVA